MVYFLVNLRTPNIDNHIFHIIAPNTAKSFYYAAETVDSSRLLRQALQATLSGSRGAPGRGRGAFVSFFRVIEILNSSGRRIVVVGTPATAPWRRSAKAPRGGAVTLPISRSSSALDAYLT